MKEDYLEKKVIDVVKPFPNLLSKFIFVVGKTISLFS